MKKMRTKIILWSVALLLVIGALTAAFIVIDNNNDKNGNGGAGSGAGGGTSQSQGDATLPQIDVPLGSGN